MSLSLSGASVLITAFLLPAYSMSESAPRDQVGHTMLMDLESEENMTVQQISQILDDRANIKAFESIAFMSYIENMLIKLTNVRNQVLEKEAEENVRHLIEPFVNEAHVFLLSARKNKFLPPSIENEIFWGQNIVMELKRFFVTHPDVEVSQSVALYFMIPRIERLIEEINNYNIH